MECEYKDCQIKKANDMNCPIEQFSVPAASCKTLSIFKAGQESVDVEAVRILANNAIYFADNSDYKPALFEVCKLLGMPSDEIGDNFIDDEAINRLGE